MLKDSRTLSELFPSDNVGVASILHFKVLIGRVCFRDLSTLHVTSSFAGALCLSKPLQSTNKDKKNQDFAKLLKQWPISCYGPKGVLPDVLLLTNLYLPLFYVLPFQKLDNKRIME